jgi:putative membrane protein
MTEKEGAVMRNILLAGVVLALAPVGALAQISTPDLAFLQQAAHADLTQVQEGKIAQTNASNPAVREYAQRMIQEHQRHYEVLTGMLKQAAIPLLPDTQAPAQVQQVALLQQQTGQAFDRAYAQAQVTNQRLILELLQGEIQNGTDVNLKAYAQQTLPIVQGNLQAAERLQGTV